MKIQINEVWTSEGRSEKIAEIEAEEHAADAVWDWIWKNRADLQVVSGINTHGFDAIAIRGE